MVSTIKVRYESIVSLQETILFLSSISLIRRSEDERLLHFIIKFSFIIFNFQMETYHRNNQSLVQCYFCGEEMAPAHLEVSLLRIN